jgi:hypothetical protein
MQPALQLNLARLTQLLYALFAACAGYKFEALCTGVLQNHACPAAVGLQVVLAATAAVQQPACTYAHQTTLLCFIAAACLPAELQFMLHDVALTSSHHNILKASIRKHMCNVLHSLFLDHM